MNNVIKNKISRTASSNTSTNLASGSDIVGKMTERMYQNNTLSKISDKIAKQIDRSNYTDRK